MLTVILKRPGASARTAAKERTATSFFLFSTSFPKLSKARSALVAPVFEAAPSWTFPSFPKLIKIGISKIT